MSNCYVYIHRKLSDGSIFYVGKGSNNRLHSKKDRNKYWHNVVNKHGFSAEIIFDDLTEEEAFEEESNVILEMRYFGCNLVNMNNGGKGGIQGYKKTPEQKRALSELHRGNKYNLGRKATKETREKLSNLRKKKVLCVEDQAVFFSFLDAANFYGVNKTSISKVCSGRHKLAKGKTFMIYEVTNG